MKKKILIKQLNLVNSLTDIKEGKSIQINTINAHSYNIAIKDNQFATALLNSDYLIPDGQSIIWAKKILDGSKLRRIAGADLFYWEMELLNKSAGKCFFLGSTNETLNKIIEKSKIEYPQLKVEIYSPPYKSQFSEEDNKIMISKINLFKPDVLFVGMTAPKQEKWVAENAYFLEVGHICSIGAVFDFYAGNIKRAPINWQKMGLEWLYRLIKEPRRMWRRYIIGNTIYIYYVFKEFFFE